LFRSGVIVRLLTEKIVWIPRARSTITPLHCYPHGALRCSIKMHRKNRTGRG
jgi:hypothetical protein